MLLLVDNRPSDFTQYVLRRTDLDVVLLRFDAFASRPNWPTWGKLPPWYRDATSRVPSFDVRPEAPLEAEAARYLRWIRSLPAAPQFFCNPEEHLQDLAQRFARLVGLPHLTEKQVRWVRDKAAMKDKFAELDIPTARYRHVRKAGDVVEFAGVHGWPVILKPTDSFASIDTYRLDGVDDLGRLFPSLPDRSWMVEEFVTGKEYQLCALVARGRVLDVYLSVNPSPLLEALDGSMNADVTVGSQSGEYALRPGLVDLVQRLVEGMGIDHAYLHMEFFICPDGTIRMSEVAARLAGGGLPRNHAIAFGFDIFGATLDLYLGRVPVLQYTNDSCAGDLLLPARAGRIVEMTPLERLLRLPGVISGQLEAAVGDYLRLTRASNARSGLVHVEGDSVAQVLERMHIILDTFHLTVE